MDQSPRKAVRLRFFASVRDNPACWHWVLLFKLSIVSENHSSKFTEMSPGEQVIWRFLG